MKIECYECGQPLDPDGDIYSITGCIEDYCEECHDKLCIACSNGIDHDDDHDAINQLVEKVGIAT